ncbi:MAG: helix-hairpin-helix domain-containing protein [Acidimicrobiales bacterium]|nr:helix-hairpin-helix domain-containing protein [Acidimicrobiales bacterium]
MSELPRPLPPPSWRDRLAVVAAWRDGVPLPALAVVVGVVVAITIAFTALRPSGVKPDVALTLPRADAPAAADTAVASPTTTTGPLRVHAAGAVVRPGVVEVPAGARVVDVVHAAGGAAPDADLNQVNLAQLVADGERIYIPRAGEAVVALASGPSSASKGADAGGIVNLNEASESELETLPGVGPATAKAIVDYRTQNGRFRSVDDLLNVRGIGPAKLEQIKPHARV